MIHRRSVKAFITIIVLIIIVIIGMLCDRWQKRKIKIEPEIEEGEVVSLSNRSRRETPRYDQKIPFVIMQTNEKSTIPEGMFNAIMKTQELNPEYKYLYFDDGGARKYLKKYYSKRFVEAYDDLIPGAYKADFFRYCFLYMNGGVYMDTGMVSIEPLRKFIKSNDRFVSVEDDGCSGIYNAFIACVPKHPIIKECLNRCIINIESGFIGTNTLQITGPDMMGLAFEKIVGRVVNPNVDYGKGVRLMYHRSGRSKRTGELIRDGHVYNCSVLVFKTKYQGYVEEMTWYNTKEHYSVLWERGEIYYSRLSINDENRIK